jgi:hypothetical protein
MTERTNPTIQEQAENLLLGLDELLTRYELQYVPGEKLSPMERYIGTHMYLMGILTNPSSKEEADAVYEAFKIRLGYTDDEIATDIIGG